ncbi:MAG TPA: extracellular solute-binding protein, partial [Microthrixaceae bacterium]|nr:extracellular solute-binding protein [Microthrixaceae bacterium]
SNEPFVMKLDPWFVEHWLTGAGQPVVDHDNGRDGLAEQSEFASERTTEVMNWLKSMKDEGLLNGVPGIDGQISHYLAMATGGSSMLMETSTAITTINSVIEGGFDPADLGADLDLPPDFKVNIDLGVGLNPGIDEPGKGQVGGGAWYITNTGSDEVQSAAWDFVKFFNETENQVTWTMEGSYLPIVESAKDDPTLQADWTTTNRGKWLQTAYDGMSLLDPDFPGPLIGPYADFRKFVRKAMESVVQQGGEVPAAIDQADTEITAALEDYVDTNF